MKVKPVAFGNLPDGSLFRIFVEKRGHYEEGEKKFGWVRSNDRRVYKKHGNSYSSTRDGHDIILALSDLVTPYVSPNYRGNRSIH